MLDLYSFTVPGQPVGKNDLYTVGRHGKRATIIKTESAREFETRVHMAAITAIREPILEGTWRITCNVFWPRQLSRPMKETGKRLCDGGLLKDGPFPFGDSDAVPLLVRDALESGLYVDDDARITITVGASHYDKLRPRVEVELRRLQ